MSEQNAGEGLASKEDKLKEVQADSDIEKWEKARLEEECEELKKLSCRLREEKDDDQYEIYELKRKIIELEAENLRAKTDAERYQKINGELEVILLSSAKEFEILGKKIGEADDTEIMKIVVSAHCKSCTGFCVVWFVATLDDKEPSETVPATKPENPKKRKVDNSLLEMQEGLVEHGKNIKLAEKEHSLMLSTVSPEIRFCYRIKYEHDILQMRLLEELGRRIVNKLSVLESLRTQLKKAVDELATTKELQKQAEAELEKEKIGRQKAEEAKEEMSASVQEIMNQESELESLRTQLKKAVDELSKARELEKKAEAELENEKIARQKAEEAKEEMAASVQDQLEASVDKCANTAYCYALRWKSHFEKMYPGLKFDLGAIQYPSDSEVEGMEAEELLNEDN